MNNKINVITLFSGLESQCMALDRLKQHFPNFDYELIYWSEIDENAIKAHNAVYPQYKDRNLGDITKIDFSALANKEIDLLTYSFPCTNISNSGKQEGFEKDSGTASSLLWYVENAIKYIRPKYLLMENVKALVQSKFIGLFREWCSVVESYGYYNFSEVLNASDFNCPQNRERVFMISILRTDSEPNPSFYLPKKMKLERRIKDILEPNVDDSFYLSDKALEYFCRVNNDKSHCHNFTPKDGDDVAFTVRCKSGERVDDNFLKHEE